MQRFTFSRIYVIESLDEGEIKTGQLLFHDIIKRRLEQKGLTDNCKLFLADSKAEFFESLLIIKEESKRQFHYPLIHFELHGSRKGLTLKNEECVSWDELRSILIEINLISSCNLFITMATCYGAYINSMISPITRSPFWGFIGSDEKVNSEEIMNNYNAFYDEFISSSDLFKGIDALNRANTTEKSFRFYCTEYAINLAYTNIENKYLSPDKIEEVLISCLIKIRENHPECNCYSDEILKKHLKMKFLNEGESLRKAWLNNFFRSRN